MTVFERRQTERGVAFVADYYEANGMVRGAMKNLIGCEFASAFGAGRVLRVGQPFKRGRNGKAIYLYVEDIDVADEAKNADVIAANEKDAAEKRYENFWRPAPSLGDDAPIGWNDRR